MCLVQVQDEFLGVFYARLPDVRRRPILLQLQHGDADVEDGFRLEQFVDGDPVESLWRFARQTLCVYPALTELFDVRFPGSDAATPRTTGAVQGDGQTSEKAEIIRVGFASPMVRRQRKDGAVVFDVARHAGRRPDANGVVDLEKVERDVR